MKIKDITHHFKEFGTDKEIFKLSNPESISIEASSETIEQVKEDYLYQKKFTGTIEYNIDLEKILGYDASQKEDNWTIQFCAWKQARKHKKKRINKKWLKLYGYKKVILNSCGWKMSNKNKNDTLFFCNKEEL